MPCAPLTTPLEAHLPWCCEGVRVSLLLLVSCWDPDESSSSVSARRGRRGGVSAASEASGRRARLAAAWAAAAAAASCPEGAGASAGRLARPGRAELPALGAAPPLLAPAARALRSSAARSSASEPGRPALVHRWPQRLHRLAWEVPSGRRQPGRHEPVVAVAAQLKQATFAAAPPAYTVLPVVMVEMKLQEQRGNGGGRGRKEGGRLARGRATWKGGGPTASGGARAAAGPTGGALAGSGESDVHGTTYLASRHGQGSALGRPRGMARGLRLGRLCSPAKGAGSFLIGDQACTKDGWGPGCQEDAHAGTAC